MTQRNESSNPIDARLDPQLRNTIDTNLAVIDRGLVEIREAIAKRPNDAALGQMLKRTYEQELAIIDAVTMPQVRRGSNALSR